MALRHLLDTDVIAFRGSGALKDELYYIKNGGYETYRFDLNKLETIESFHSGYRGCLGDDDCFYWCGSESVIYKYNTRTHTNTTFKSFNISERTYPHPLFALQGKVCYLPGYNDPFISTGGIILESGTIVEPTTKLSPKDENSIFQIYKGYVYTNLQSGYLSKFDNRLGLIKNYYVSAGAFCIGDDDYIYFANINDNYYLYRIKIDGSGLEKLASYSVDGPSRTGIGNDSLIFYNNNIYFLSNMKFLRYRIKAKEVTMLNEGTNWRCIYCYNNKAYLGSVFAKDGLKRGIYSLDLNAPPVISPASRNLGTFVAPFNTSYTASDPNNDKLTVTEKLDGKVINTRTNVASGSSYTISINGSTWDNISAGTHTIKVTADDSEETCIATYTFVVGNKAQNPPTLITPNNHRFYNEFYVEFKIGTDLDNNNQSCTLYVSKNSNAEGESTFSNVEKFNTESNTWEDISTINNANANDLLKIKANVDYSYTNEKVYFKIKTYDGANTKYSSIGYCYINPILEFKTTPETCPFMPRFLTLYDKKVLDNKCSIQVFATNNALDDIPVWEDITDVYKQGTSHKFTNKVKAHENWAYSIHYRIQANDAIGTIEINNFALGVS